MKRKLYNPNLIEVRFRVDKIKDAKLFEKMSEYKEVNWSEVCRSGIITYLNKRNRQK